MATTQQDVVIPKKVWTELYALTGIASGTQIDIYNKGACAVNVSNSLLAPSVPTGYPLYAFDSITVPLSTLKVWVYASDSDATLSVQESVLSRQKQGAEFITYAHTLGMPFPHAVALNLVPGASRVVALGVNADINTGTLPEDVWPLGGLYPWLSAATYVSVASNSANDSSSSGTGARTVLLVGLDNLYNVQSEILTLDGLTPVISTKQYLRVNSLIMMSAGSSRINIGDIDAKNNSNGTDILARLVAGKGATRSSNYTVPAGYTLAIDSLFIGVNRPSSTVDISVATYFGSPQGFYRLPLEISCAANPYRHDTNPPIMVSEKTDFMLRATYVSANNTNITGAWSGILYQNSLITAP